MRSQVAELVDASVKKVCGKPLDAPLRYGMKCESILLNPITGLSPVLTTSF